MQYSDNGMKELLESVRPYGAIPVFCPKNADEIKTFCEVVARSPLPAVEITLRDPLAFELIATLKKDFPNVKVGAGTVNNAELCEQAIGLNVDFLVSPGYSDELLEIAESHKVPFLPGCTTATEIQNAVNHGLKYLKFFPAEACGGAKAVKLFAGPFGSVQFVPTGGVNLENLPSYLALKNVVACGGSFMIPSDKLKNHDVDGILEVINGCIDMRK